jgi:hypothetical protein
LGNLQGDVNFYECLKFLLVYAARIFCRVCVPGEASQKLAPQETQRNAEETYVACEEQDLEAHRIFAARFG